MISDVSDSENVSAVEKYRREHGLSMEAFGALFDPPVHKSTVLRWERHGVSDERMKQIEKVTGIPRRKLRPDLFDDTEGKAA
jgi:hypothetical protein